jgi:hypothetical protein
MAEILKYPAVELKIGGYTDNVGDLTFQFEAFWRSSKIS